MFDNNLSDLQKYFIEKGAIKKVNREEKILFYQLSICNRGDDRFNFYLTVWNSSPTTIHVLRAGVQGWYFDSDQTIRDDWNELNTNFKNAYLAFIEELKKNKIKFYLNKEDM